MTTPVSDPENHYIKIDGVSELLENGVLTGRITITGEGQSDAAIRGFFRYSNRTAWYQNVERELLRLYPQAKVLQVKYHDPADYLNFNAWVAIDFSIPGFAMGSGKKLIFTPLSAAGIFRNIQAHLLFDTGLKERKYPFRDRCTRMVEINETIRIPAGVIVSRIPPSVEKTSPAASFSGGYTVTPEAVVFSARSSFGKRVYDPSDWPGFRAAVDAQNRFADQSVLLDFQPK